MNSKKINLSPRLKAIVEALPLYAGIRVLEIGCGSGVVARAVANRIGEGYILAIDRSPRSLSSQHQAPFFRQMLARKTEPLVL